MSLLVNRLYFQIFKPIKSTDFGLVFLFVEEIIHIVISAIYTLFFVNRQVYLAM